MVTVPMEEKWGWMSSSCTRMSGWGRMLGGMELSGTQLFPVSQFHWGNPCLGSPWPGHRACVWHHSQALLSLRTNLCALQPPGWCCSPRAGCPHPGPPARWDLGVCISSTLGRLSSGSSLMLHVKGSWGRPAVRLGLSDMHIWISQLCLQRPCQPATVAEVTNGLLFLFPSGLLPRTEDLTCFCRRWRHWQTA